MEVVKHLVCEADFLREIMEVVALDLRGSTVALYQRKWSWFLHWCHGQNISLCKATIPQITKFFLYLQRELKLSVLAVESYCATLNHVSSLAGKNLPANHVIRSAGFSVYSKRHVYRERLNLRVEPVIGLQESYSSTL